MTDNLNQSIVYTYDEYKNVVKTAEGKRGVRGGDGRIRLEAETFTFTSGLPVNELAERLATPLQIEQHLRLAFEEAYRIGQKLVTAEIIDSILAKDIVR